MAEEKNPILTVRLPDGSTQSIIALQGTSAYEMAKSQGYEGTELDLSQALSLVSGGFRWIWNEGSSLGPHPIMYFGQNEYFLDPIPSASVNTSGILTTGAQSISGNKSFFNSIILTQPDDSVGSAVQLSFKPKYINSSSTISSNGGCYILAYDDEDNVGNGCNLVINSGAAVLIGGGEAPYNFYNYFWSKPANKEELFLLSDANINFYTSCGSFNSTDKVFTSPPVHILTLSGAAGYPGVNNTYTWGTSSYKWKNIYATTFNGNLTGNVTGVVNTSRINGTPANGSFWQGRDIALLRMSTADAQYRPILSVSTSGGGSWELGEYKDEKLQLAYVSKTAYNESKSSSANSTKIVYIKFDSSGGLSLPGGLSATTGTFSSTITATGKITGNGGLSTTTISASGASTLKALSATTGTFSAVVKITGGSDFKNTDGTGGYLIIGSSSGDKIIFDNNEMGCFTGDAPNNLYLHAKAIFLASTCHLYPSTTEAQVLGNDTHRWKNIYSKNAVNVGSDIRTKIPQDSIILSKLLNLYDQITPIAYKFKNIYSYDDHDRIHVGLSAQEVEEKLIENGLTRLDFGGFCADPVFKKDEFNNNTEEVIDEAYSLRYGEFHGLHILKNQQQDIRIKDLEEKNQQLENTIAELKTQLELIKLAIGG